MSRHRKKNGIPDRWLDYKAVGKRLDGTRFVAFKVPLKQSLNRQLPCSDVFGPWELLDTLSKENQQLGLIIDLTFTTRYYSVQDIPESLLFVKIFTAGHEVPSDETILNFKRAVGRFLRENTDNDKLIGVHCTHGVNRTGYLICRYLIDVDGMDPEDAVQLFSSSRGHAIERHNYLEDLRHGPKRSNRGMEESKQEPIRGCAVHQLFNSGSSREKRRVYLDGSWHHRSLSLTGTNQRSHHQRPHDGLLPSPPLPPPPLLPPPMGAPFHHPYRCPPPHPDVQWRRPPRSEEIRSRCSPAETEWSRSFSRQEDRRRAAPPPLPRYSARWTHTSNGHDRPEKGECFGPQRRHHHRHTHRVNNTHRVNYTHRVNTHHNY